MEAAEIEAAEIAAEAEEEADVAAAAVEEVSSAGGTQCGVLSVSHRKPPRSNPVLFAYLSTFAVSKYMQLATCQCTTFNC